MLTEIKFYSLLCEATGPIMDSVTSTNVGSAKLLGEVTKIYV
jgi:hypothetical protein